MIEGCRYSRFSHAKFLLPFSRTSGRLSLTPRNGGEVAENIWSSRPSGTYAWGLGLCPPRMPIVPDWLTPEKNRAGSVCPRTPATPITGTYFRSPRRRTSPSAPASSAAWGRAISAPAVSTTPASIYWIQKRSWRRRVERPGWPAGGRPGSFWSPAAAAELFAWRSTALKYAKALPSSARGVCKVSISHSRI